MLSRWRKGTGDEGTVEEGLSVDPQGSSKSKGGSGVQNKHDHIETLERILWALTWEQVLLRRSYARELTSELQPSAAILEAGSLQTISVSFLHAGSRSYEERLIALG